MESGDSIIGVKTGMAVTQLERRIAGGDLCV